LNFLLRNAFKKSLEEQGYRCSPRILEPQGSIPKILGATKASFEVLHQSLSPALTIDRNWPGSYSRPRSAFGQSHWVIRSCFRCGWV